tara:strand:- start:1171 stop:8307 length:7137 start_codon:yes stop_codon:yes gene_type:complete
MSRVSNQSGRVLDAISAGPIEGLVNGKESIFFNDTAIQSAGAKSDVIDSTTINTVASVTSNSNIVRVPSASVENIDVSTISTYPRWLWVEGVGRKVELSVYGGLAVVDGQNRGSQDEGEGWMRQDTSQSTGKAIQVYPWTGNGFDSNRADPVALGTDYRKLFLKETIDLEYLARTGSFAVQGATSKVKQTFTAHVNYETWRSGSNSYTRTHYLSSVSKVFRDTDNLNLGRATSAQLWDIFTLGEYKFGDADALPKAYGRTGKLGNGGTDPSGYPVGDNDSSWLRFDLLAKIIDITPSSQAGFHDLEIEVSNEANSWAPAPPALSKQIARAHVFTTFSEGVSAAKFRGTSEFRNGERGQTAIGNDESGVNPPRTNVIINPNTQLLWGNNYARGTAAPTIYTSSGTSNASLGLSALQAAQVDAIRLNILFPSGLYRVSENGNYSKAPFDAVIKFRHRNSITEDFQEEVVKGVVQQRDWWDVSNNGGYSGLFDEEGIGLLISENRKGTFSREVELDLTRFQPFTDFEIEIDRTTPDNYEDYTSNIHRANSSTIKQASLTASVQYVQALFYDKFTYPLTAYAAVTFSGADFDSMPARSYHCRGLKIKVPSNYVTREEDALMSGTKTGVARYSRLKLQLADIDINNRETTVEEKTVLRNIVTNTMTAASIPGGLGFSEGQGNSVDMQPNPDGLVTRLMQVQPRVNPFAQRLFLNLNPQYSIYGTTGYNLTSEVDSVDITDSNGLTTTYTTYDTTSSDGLSEVLLSVGFSGDAATADLVSGQNYTVKINFKNDIIRPNDYVVWDGTFRDANVYTNNPAWIFYDILTNVEYGLGDYIKPQDIDIYELYAISRYCDELVPDGKGGLEPRFTCNTYITKSTEAYKVLKDLASVFRGMTVWQNSQISPVQDRPKEPLYLFTQANVLDGLFSYERTGIAASTNSVELTWNDPEQQYRQDVLILDDLDSQLQLGRVSSTKSVAYGCTSKGQAKRAAEWHMLSNTREGKIVSFKSSLNSASLKIGDVVTIQDQQRGLKISSSGRVESYDGDNTVQLDRIADLDPAKSYLFCVQVSDSVFHLQQDTAIIDGIRYQRGQIIEKSAYGEPLFSSNLSDMEVVDDSNNTVVVQKTDRTSIIKKEIINPGQSSTVLLSSPINYFVTSEREYQSTQPYRGHEPSSTDQLKEHVWAIAENTELENSLIEDYRIISITHSSDNMNVEFKGVLFDRSKFGEIDTKNSTLSDPFFDDELASSVMSIPVNASASMTADLVTETGAGSSLGGYDLIVQWNVPSTTVTDSNGNSFDIQARDIAGYSVEHDVYQTTSPNGTDTITVTGSNNTQVKLLNVDEGTYTFKIRSFGYGKPLRYSEPLVFVKTVSPPVGVGKVGRIPRGGDINSTLDFSTSSGLLTILKSNYLFKTVSNYNYDVTSSNSSTSQQSFSSLANGSSAYWLYSHSSALSGDPWKAAEIHVDSVTKDGLTENTTSFPYLKELGASNNGLSLLSSGRAFAVSKLEVVQPNSKVVLTTTAPNYLEDGDTISLSGIQGMSELNGQTVVARIYHSSVQNQVVLYTSDNSGLIDGSTLSDYASGGVVTTSSEIRGSGTKNSPTLKGVNTSFTTDFKSGDLIKITTSSSIGTEVATSEYCEIELVVDDHTLNLVTPLTRSYTNAYLFTQTLKISIVNDTILAKISKAADIFSIEYDTTFKSLDTSEGESITQYATVRAGSTFIVDDQGSRGEMARLNMSNSSGVQATASARATVEGSLGVRSKSGDIKTITSSSIAVFETNAAHGLYDYQEVELSGIAANYPTHLLNGTIAKVVLGSGGMSTGNQAAEFVFVSKTGTPTATGSTAGVEIVNSSINVVGAINATCTVSCTTSALTIISVDTPGAGYRNDTDFFVTIALGGVTFTFLCDHDDLIVADKTTKFRLVYPETPLITTNWGGTVPGAKELADYISTEGITAQSAASGEVFQQNALNLTLGVVGTFPESTKTLPASLIVAKGRYRYDVGLSGITNAYIDVEDSGVGYALTQSTYNLFNGADFNQFDGDDQTFHANIVTVFPLSSTKIRVVFQDIFEGTFFTDTSNAINIGSLTQVFLNNQSDPLGIHETIGSTSGAAAVVLADTGAGDLVFTNVVPSSTSGAGDIAGGDGLLVNFTVREDGSVNSISVARQGAGGFKEAEVLTFTDGYLNGLTPTDGSSGDYGSTRGDIVLYVDINGDTSTSLNASVTYGGDTEIIVDQVTGIRNNTSASLEGSLTTKTNSSFEAVVRGFMDTASGFEIGGYTNYGTSNSISLFSGDNLHSHLGEGSTLKIVGANLGDSTTYYQGPQSADSQGIAKPFKTRSDNYTATSAVVGTGLTAPTDYGTPGASGFVRGSNGFVVGETATTITSVVLDGELKV